MTKTGFVNWWLLFTLVATEGQKIKISEQHDSQSLSSNFLGMQERKHSLDGENHQ
jgi:hypothetical protein